MPDQRFGAVVFGRNVLCAYIIYQQRIVWVFRRSKVSSQGFKKREDAIHDITYICLCSSCIDDQATQKKRRDVLHVMSSAVIESHLFFNRISQLLQMHVKLARKDYLFFLLLLFFSFSLCWLNVLENSLGKTEQANCFVVAISRSQRAYL